jgi:hypothetical protein
MRISNPSPYFETTEQVLYNLKNIILTTTAIITLSATSVFANEINFEQNDTVGLSTLNVEQSGGGTGNIINVNTSGDVTSVANGLVDESLQIGGNVNGDDNIVKATIGAADDIAFNYDIIGDDNSYTSTIAGPASGGRTVDVSLTGDSNVWTVTANASAGILNVDSTGDSVTGTHTQTGASSELVMDINKSGAAAFAVTTTQTGAASADVTINADGGGAFTLTQTGALASYTGTLNISAGGAVTITQ